MRKAVVCAAMMTLVACGAALEERVVRSFAEMERVARTAGPDGLRPRKVGQVEFESVYRDGDRVHCVVGEDGPHVDPYGYVWSPVRRPVDDSDPAVASSFEHIQGPWYRWSDSY
ncbi:hypothetical protein [Herbidospora yilanensis]|uniref:hypothetical protein n=1 Tax=Herbidospora yilanensis TaxID=354426 RepID=UPI000784816B|nr:hypothetical protein [Herbidospora yilanensis]